MPTLKEGQVFERYFVTQWLGSGVSGESYEAKDIILQQKVTLKLIHPWAPLPDAARRQFFREMQSISRLKHPYLTPVLDYGEINDRLYVTRQHTTHGSLLSNEGRLWFRPPLSIPDAIHYGYQLAQIVEHIHNCGQLHGALTFTNILVLHSSNSEHDHNHLPFLLTDVGLANFVRCFGQPQISALPITAAPEQLSKRVTSASDQFALAALLFFWLAGRPPYLGSPEEVKYLKLTETIPSLLSFNPRVTIEQEAVLLRALAAYPDRRYPSILEFADALSATLTHQTQTKLDTKFLIQPESSLAPEPHPAPEPLPAPDIPMPFPEPHPAPEPLPVPEDIPESLPEPPLAPEPLPAPDIPIPFPEPHPAPEPLPESKFTLESLPEPHPAFELWHTPEPLPESKFALESLPEPHPAFELWQTPEFPLAPEASPNPVPWSPRQQSPLQEMPPIIPSRFIISSPYTEVIREVILKRGETRLGRAGASDIVLDYDAQISRHHALLTCADDYYIIYDLHSVSGVFVNGQKLMRDLGCILLDGDHVHIGYYELLFRSGTHEASDETTHASSEADKFNDKTHHPSSEAVQFSTDEVEMEKSV